MPVQTQRLILTSLQMADAFERLDINSVPRSNNLYAFPSHTANEEQVEPGQHDGHRATDSNAVGVVCTEVEVCSSLSLKMLISLPRRSRRQ